MTSQLFSKYYERLTSHNITLFSDIVVLQIENMMIVYYSVAKFYNSIQFKDGFPLKMRVVSQYCA